MNQDDQPITRKELKEELKEFATTIVNQLRSEMKAQGEQLRSEMRDQGEQLRGEMRSMESALRYEFDAKITAAKNELKLHTAEVVAEHSGEVMQAIASVVEPLQATTARHERQLARL